MTLSDAAQVAKEEYLAGKIDLRQLIALYEEGGLSTSEYEEIRTFQKNLDTPITLEEQEELMGSMHEVSDPILADPEYIKTLAEYDAEAAASRKAEKAEKELIDDLLLDVAEQRKLGVKISKRVDEYIRNNPEDMMQYRTSMKVEEIVNHVVTLIAAGVSSAPTIEGEIVDLSAKRAEKKQLEAKKPVAKPKAEAKPKKAAKPQEKKFEDGDRVDIILRGNAFFGQVGEVVGRNADGFYDVRIDDAFNVSIPASGLKKASAALLKSLELTQENKVAKLPEGEDKVAKDIKAYRAARHPHALIAADEKEEIKKAAPKRKTLAEKEADLVAAVEKAAEPKAKKAKQVEGPDNGNGRKRGVRWAVKECVLANPTMKPVDILAEINKAGVSSKEESVASIRQDFLMTLRAAKNLNKLSKSLAASVTDMKGNRKSSTALLIYNELIIKNPQVTEKELYEEMKKLGHQVAGQGSYSAIRESLAVLREGKALS